MVDTPWDVWLRLRERFGRWVTLVDLYELEALLQQVDVEALTRDDRERLKSMWRTVALPGWAPSPTLARRDDPVEIVDYDESWPERFRAWRERLATALGDGAVSIDHVGSTAVPGLPAKPVIDVQVLVSDVEDESAYLRYIELAGVPLHSRDPGHRYFRPGPGQPRDIQIHVHDSGSHQAHDRIVFRDYLRANPAARQAYAQLKRQLARRYEHDRVAYAEAKTGFVLTTVEAARREGYRPSIDA